MKENQTDKEQDRGVPMWTTVAKYNFAEAAGRQGVTTLAMDGQLDKLHYVNWYESKEKETRCAWTATSSTNSSRKARRTSDVAQ